MYVSLGMGAVSLNGPAMIDHPMAGNRYSVPGSYREPLVYKELECEATAGRFSAPRDGNSIRQNHLLSLRDRNSGPAIRPDPPRRMVVSPIDLPSFN
jgi:hypothetical protein